MLVGLATSAPGVTPIPDKVTDALEAEEVIATLPETDPPALGTKTTLNGKLCPAARVAGRLRPLSEKPLPLALTWLTVMLEFPELESVAVCVDVFPTVTLPKLSAPGVTFNWPAATPDPDTATVSEVLFDAWPVDFPWPKLVVSDAEPVMEMLPFVAPEDLGEKASVKFTDCPDPRVFGSVSPLSV